MNNNTNINTCNWNYSAFYVAFILTLKHKNILQSEVANELKLPNRILADIYLGVDQYNPFIQPLIFHGWVHVICKWIDLSPAFFCSKSTSINENFVGSTLPSFSNTESESIPLGDQLREINNKSIHKDLENHLNNNLKLLMMHYASENKRSVTIDSGNLFDLSNKDTRNFISDWTIKNKFSVNFNIIDDNIEEPDSVTFIW